MAGVDLGKQIGPLPLGAWIGVVAIGGGIAWYTRRQGSGEPTIVEDTSGMPGVGTGAVGGWVPTTGAPTGETKPTTNEEWAIKMVQWLIGKGYDPVRSETAVRKYVNQAKLDVQEFTLVTLAMAVIGPPPQGLSYIPDDPATDPAPTEPELFYLEGSRPAVWALANGPSGGWRETNSQLQANAWAAMYQSNEIATHVNQSTWNSLKAKYGGGS